MASQEKPAYRAAAQMTTTAPGAGAVVSLGGGAAARPNLVSGVLAAHRSAFSSNGTRIFAPCGGAVVCYSVRTGKQLGALSPESGRVTAVAAGPAQAPMTAGVCLEPLAIAAGEEVSLWDSHAAACLCRIAFGAPILALCWPQPGRLLVARGTAGDAEVEMVDTSRIDAATRASPLPLNATSAGQFDAAGEIAALTDGRDLLVFREGWGSCRRHTHKHMLTALSIDPAGRYVATGDAKGVVWLWWGVADERVGQADAPCVPGRWHWHANPVRELAHCGPLLLSGGEEGVLCVRNVEDETVQYIPRFPATLRHLAVSPSGDQVCISVESNSLALVSSLHGWAKPRYIHALDVPVAAQERLLAQAKLPSAALHVLGGGGLATTCGGRRVQFLDERGKLLAGRSVQLNRGNTTVTTGDPMRRWSLRHVAFSSRAGWLLTCESRRCPAMEKYDADAPSQSSVLKWWRRDKEGQYVVDCVANDPHSADISAALAHPENEGVFLTASLDGTFKSWGVLPGDPSGGWHCLAVGSWRSRPMLSGCFSSDGSTVALGFHGYVVLWDLATMTELRALPAGDGSDRVVQLSSAVASGRFLLLAGVQRAQRQEVICWDLVQMQPLARVDVSAALGGVQRVLFRTEVVPSRSGSGNDLRLLAFRAGGLEVCVWRFAKKGKASEDAAALGFVEEARATFPGHSRVLDVALMGGADATEACRVVCWTSCYELWSLDLLGAGVQNGNGVAAKVPQEALEEDETPRAPSTLAGQVLAQVGGPPNRGPRKPEELVDYPVRTTPEQQAGLVPRLAQLVAPPHVPSHMLPPPSALLATLLDVYAKPSPSAAAARLLAGEALQPAEAKGAPGGSAEGPPPGARRELEAASTSELVDAAWMEELLSGALLS